MTNLEYCKMKIYRYLNSAAAIQTIETRSLRVGRILEFNDPFEWQLGIKGLPLQCEKEIYRAIQDWLEDRNSVAGIVCFSAKCKEPLLWAHYADRHRGIVLEFDYDETSERLEKIIYSKNRVVLDIPNYKLPHFTQGEFVQFAQKMVTQKSLGWKYEQEYRLHVDLKDCDVHSGSFFIGIPDSVLRRVICGYRCDVEKLYLRRLLDKVDLNDVKIVDATINQSTYRIEF